LRRWYCNAMRESRRPPFFSDESPVSVMMSGTLFLFVFSGVCRRVPGDGTDGEDGTDRMQEAEIIYILLSAKIDCNHIGC
ncbi:hypothetical protein, partial [uncultured Prevotella sp.]|uniref:hypothetical protein n=1 Tax=uncultured Prevotella sp. TaxID=159272 RepID=UPI0026078D6E